MVYINGAGKYFLKEKKLILYEVVVGTGEVHNPSETGVPPLIFPAPAPPPPPPLQNVETFGSFLGEEIVANWRRSLERTILSQGAAATPTPMTGQQPPPTPTPTPPQHVQDNSEEPASGTVIILF